SPAAAAQEIFPEHLAVGRFGGDKIIVNVSRPRVRRQCADEIPHLRIVARPNVGRARGDRFTRFRVHEFDPLEGWQFKLVLVQDLKEKYLEMPVAKAVQRAEDRFRLIQKIGNYNQQPPSPKE